MRISIESPTPILVKKHYNSVHLSSLLVSCSAYGNGTEEERFFILKSTKQLLIRKIHYLATNIGKYREYKHFWITFFPMRLFFFILVHFPANLPPRLS